MEQLTPVIERQAPAKKKTAPEIIWKGYEKFAFRVAFIFFFLLTVPLDVDYYKGWFTTD